MVPTFVRWTELSNQVWEYDGRWYLVLCGGKGDIGVNSFASMEDGGGGLSTTVSVPREAIEAIKHLASAMRLARPEPNRAIRY
jgi:hypothetical protein